MGLAKAEREYGMRVAAEELNKARAENAYLRRERDRLCDEIEQLRAEVQRRGDYTREGLKNITPCRHDEESAVSLIEQHGYSEDDIVACKLCLKDENERLRGEVRTAFMAGFHAGHESARNGSAVGRTARLESWGNYEKALQTKSSCSACGTSIPDGAKYCSDCYA